MGCERCGVPIAQPTTGRPRRFCGDACRKSFARHQGRPIEWIPVPEGIDTTLTEKFEAFRGGRVDRSPRQCWVTDEPHRCWQWRRVEPDLELPVEVQLGPRVKRTPPAAAQRVQAEAARWGWHSPSLVVHPDEDTAWLRMHRGMFGVELLTAVFHRGDREWFYAPEESVARVKQDSPAPPAPVLVPDPDRWVALRAGVDWTPRTVAAQRILGSPHGGPVSGNSGHDPVGELERLRGTRPSLESLTEPLITIEMLTEMLVTMEQIRQVFDKFYEDA